MNRTKASRTEGPAAPTADPYADNLARIGDLAVRCGERLTAFQAHGCTLALTEAARLHRSFLHHVEAHPLPLQWPELARSQALRSSEILCGWWEATLRAQDALLAGLRDCFDLAGESEAIPDRRLRRVVIPFPDRRAA